MRPARGADAVTFCNSATPAMARFCSWRERVSNQFVVALKQPRVGEHLRQFLHVRESHAGNDAVEEPGIIVRDLVLLVGAARGAPPKRKRRLAVSLDEALLHHHHGFGREHVVATVAGDVERRARFGIALAHHGVADHSVRKTERCSLLEPAAEAAAPERIKQTPVPALRRRHRAGLSRRRVMQHRKLINRAIDRAGLDAHDEGNLLARRRGGPGHVRRAAP